MPKLNVTPQNLEKLGIFTPAIFTGTDDNIFIMIGEQRNVLRLNYLFPRKDGSEQVTIEQLKKRVSRSQEMVTYHDTDRTLYSRHTITYLNFYRQINISSVKLA